MQTVTPGHLNTYATVTNTQLEQLQPYAQHVINVIDRTDGPLAGRTDAPPSSTHFSNEEVARLLWIPKETSIEALKASTLSVEGDHFTVANAQVGVTPELVKSLQKLLKQAITENAVVPQGNVRHRVIEFIAEGEQLAVKYAQMGEQNDFNASIRTLSEIFPSV